MKINEISNQDKLVLALKGIRYDFICDYSNVISVYGVVGKSINRRNILKSDIQNILSDITSFVNYGFLVNDPDILATKNIYTELQNIYKSL